MRGGGRLRNYEGAEEQVSVLPVQEVHRTGYGPAGGPRRPDAWRKEFWRSVQPLQGKASRAKVSTIKLLLLLIYAINLCYDLLR